MSNIKLIAIDMDGTLLNDDGIVSDYTKNILNEAIQRGIKVVLSTGRPLQMCSMYYEDLKLSSYLITANGAEVWKGTNNLLARFPIEAKKVEKLWHLGHEEKLHMWLAADDELFPNATRPNNFYEYTWLKMGYGNLTENSKSQLLERLKMFQDIEITNSSLTNIEVNQKDVHKASALRYICAQSGIQLGEMMAFGDSLNDLKMLDQVGLGIAVNNAQEDILKIADHITDSNNDDGVAKAIELYAL